MKLSYAAYTNTGSREGNEDSFVVLAQNDVELSAGTQFLLQPTGWENSKPAEAQLFAIADGLGGHSSGEIASQIATEQTLHAFMLNPDDLATCFERGQAAIMKRQAEDATTKDMKTTLVVLRIAGIKANWAHIGDTRLYHFVNGRIHTRTLDHSVPQMLVALGEIAESDIRHHEDRNRLIKVMGIEWPSPRYELSGEVCLQGSDSFLLATDGFWEYVEDADMESSLQLAASPKQWLSEMLKVAEKNALGSKRDNFTAITVFVREKSSLFGGST